jgi:hypothetical protein
MISSRPDPRGNQGFSTAVPVRIVRRSDGQPLGGVIDLVVGDQHSCARTQNQGVWCWGYQPSLVDSISAMPIRDLDNSIALAAGGGRTWWITDRAIFLRGSRLAAISRSLR